MVTLELFFGEIHYILELTSKVTRITGDSGELKTRIWKTAREANLQGHSDDVKMTCPLKVSTVDITEKDALEKNFTYAYTDKIVIVDEGTYSGNVKLVNRCIANSYNSYFIFLGRRPLSFLPYSYKSIYKLDQVSHNTFKLKQVYPHSTYIGNMTDFNKVAAEDSNAGFQMFQLAFNSKGVSVVSAGGNKKVKFLGDNALSIVDGSAYGNLIEAFLSKNSFYILCLPESFEWLLFYSGIIRSYKITDEDINMFFGFVSFERFCTEKTKECLSTYGIDYNKSDLPKALTTESCVKRIYNAIMELLKDGGTVNA